MILSCDVAHQNGEPNRNYIFLISSQSLAMFFAIFIYNSKEQVSQELDFCLLQNDTITMYKKPWLTLIIMIMKWVSLM